MRKVLLAALMLPFTAVAANAATIVPTVTSSAGTSYNAAALTGFSTNSANMVGSIVTVTFQGGTTSSGTWTATGASNTGWSLSVSGDTYSSPWTFANSGNAAIVGFSFNGVPGNTVFDIVSGSDGSPQSADGRAMTSVVGPANLAVSANYTNRLLVGGTFYNDLYTRMDVSFGGAGLLGGQSLNYVTDTDNALASAGGITPGVPEPATWAMMLLGFGALGGVLRRRPQVSARIRLA